MLALLESMSDQASAARTGTPMTSESPFEQLSRSRGSWPTRTTDPALPAVIVRGTAEVHGFCSRATAGVDLIPVGA